MMTISVFRSPNWGPTSFRCPFGSRRKTGIESLRKKACCSTTTPRCPCELISRLAPKSRPGWVARHPEQPLASDDVGWKLGLKEMPEAFGVEGQFCPVHKRANAIFLRLWGVLLFVQLFNPSRTFLGFFKVKQSCVRDARGIDLTEVGFDDLGTRIQFFEACRGECRDAPQTPSRFCSE